MLGWGFLLERDRLAFQARKGLLSSMDKFTEIKQREAKSRKRTIRIREKGTLAERQKEQERNSFVGEAARWPIVNLVSAVAAMNRYAKRRQ